MIKQNMCSRNKNNLHAFSIIEFTTINKEMLYHGNIYNYIFGSQDNNY